MKIIIVYTAPVPYREKLFSALDKKENIDLTVFYCARQLSCHDWRFKEESYDKVFLPSRKICGQALVNFSIFHRLSSSNPDAVIIWGWSFPSAILALLGSRILGIPSVIFSDTGLPMYRNFRGILKKIVTITKRLIVRIPEGFIVQGKLSKRYLQSLGISEKLIHILPVNCIDTEYWRVNSQLNPKERLELKKQLGITAKRLILYAGRLIEGKGLESLLKAYSLVKETHPEIVLLVVGDGPRKDFLEREAKKNGLKDVHFIGPRAYEDLPKIFGLSGFLVLPTLSDQWPLVILEAMSCGMPVVTTTSCGSIPDLIEGKDTGLVVAPDDFQELAVAMSKILALQPHENRLISQKAMVTAAKYDFRVAAEKLSNFLLFNLNK